MTSHYLNQWWPSFWCIYPHIYTSLSLYKLSKIRTKDKKIVYWLHDYSVISFTTSCSVHLPSSTWTVIFPCEFIPSIWVPNAAKRKKKSKIYFSFSTPQQHKYAYVHNHIDGLVSDCSISITNALDILQSCIRPSIYMSMHQYKTVITSLLCTGVTESILIIFMRSSLFTSWHAGGIGSVLRETYNHSTGGTTEWHGPTGR